MSAPPYMKLYIADYHVETTDLDVIGHGAYLLLLMAMWRAAGKLSRDDEKLRKLAKCSPEQWASVRDDVLGHFKVSGGSLTHARVRKEIDKYDAVVVGSKLGGETTQKRKRNKNRDQAYNVPSENIEGSVNQPEPEPEPQPQPKPESNGGVVVAFGREPHIGDRIAGKPDWERDWPDTSEAIVDGAFAAAGPGLADRAKAPGLLTTSGEIFRWRIGGCSWELDVLPTIKALTSARKASPINTWAYFTPAVTRARDARLSPLPTPQTGDAPHGTNRTPQSAKLDARQANHARALAGAKMASRRRAED